MVGKMHELAGKCILITRPQKQAEVLADAMSHYGAKCIIFPSIEIQARQSSVDFIHISQQLEMFDLAIFISPNAVDFGLANIASCPSSLRVAAIGAGTAKALTMRDWPVHLLPASPYNSESLLADPDLAMMNGQRVVIFCGEGGRDLLANTLQERGASVSKAVAYGRICPNTDPALLLKFWDEMDVVVTTSNEGLQNLYKILREEGVKHLNRTQLLVISQGMLQTAKDLGYPRDPIVAENATGEGIIQALLTWNKE